MSFLVWKIHDKFDSWLQMIWLRALVHDIKCRYLPFGRHSWMRYQHERSYCWWKKSYTTWYVKDVVNNEITYQPQLVIAGFLPSTVQQKANLPGRFFPNNPWLLPLNRPFSLSDLLHYVAQVTEEEGPVFQGVDDWPVLIREFGASFVWKLILDRWV